MSDHPSFILVEIPNKLELFEETEATMADKFTKQFRGQVELLLEEVHTQAWQKK